MSLLKLKYTLPFVLITVAAIAGVQLFYSFVEKRILVDSPASVPPANHTAGRSGGGGGNAQTGTADIGSITSRNLFFTREKAPEVIVDEPVVEIRPTSLTLVLMGTITGTDGIERAVIYDKKERKQELYQEGDSLQQASIKEIMRGKVIVSNKGRDELLDIADARDVKVPRYKKPRLPVTASQRVVGRPVRQKQASEAAAGTSAPVEQAAGVPSSAPQITIDKGGVIVKERVNKKQDPPASE